MIKFKKILFLNFLFLLLNGLSSEAITKDEKNSLNNLHIGFNLLRSSVEWYSRNRNVLALMNDGIYSILFVYLSLKHYKI